MYLKKMFISAEINLKNKSVKTPRFTTDGKTLIWLQRNAGGPHAACMSLVKSAAPLTETVSLKYKQKSSYKTSCVC